MSRQVSLFFLITMSLSICFPMKAAKDSSILVKCNQSGFWAKLKESGDSLVSADTMVYFDNLAGNTSDTLIIGKQGFDKKEVYIETVERLTKIEYVQLDKEKYGPQIAVRFVLEDTTIEQLTFSNEVRKRVDLQAGFGYKLYIRLKDESPVEDPLIIINEKHSVEVTRLQKNSDSTNITEFLSKDDITTEFTDSNSANTSIIHIEAKDSLKNRTGADIAVYWDRTKEYQWQEIRNHALLIGISDGTEQTSLATIEEIKKLLIEYLGYKLENINTIDSVTSESLKDLLFEYSNKKKYDKGILDQLLIVIAGQAHYDTTRETAYLITYDSTDAENKKKPNEYGMSFPLLLEAVSKIDCDHILLVMDTGEAGRFLSEYAEEVIEEATARPIEDELIDMKLSSKTRLLLTHGSEKNGMIWPDGKTGLFMESFISGLSENSSRRPITLRELKAGYMDAVLSPDPFLRQISGNESGSIFLFKCHPQKVER